MAGIIFNAILSYVIIRNQDIPDKKRLANILNHITVVLMTTNVIFLICSFNIWINNLELILCFNWLVYMSFIDRHTGLVYEFMEYYGIIPVISGLIRIVVGKYNTGNKESLFVILLFISVLYYILYIWGIYGEGDADVFIIVGIVLSLYTAYNNEIFVFAECIMINAGLFCLSSVLFVLLNIRSINWKQLRLVEEKPYIPSIFLAYLCILMFTFL